MFGFAGVAMLVTSLSLVACEDDQDADGVSHTGTIQGVVVNALTGESISEGLRVSLMIDGRLKDASVLTFADEINPVTQFGFTSVPADVELPIVAIHPEFQDFEGLVKLNSFMDGGGYLEKAVLNANIQLYPLGYSVPTYTVRVVHNGAPVPDAVVFVNPAENGNHPLTFGNFLPAVSNRLGGFAVVTGSDGTVDLPSDELVLGGAYVLNVAPVEFNGEVMAASEDRNLVVGASNVVVTISITNISTTQRDNLYITSTNNDELPIMNSYSGIQINFSLPIEIISMWSCRVSTFGGDSNNNDQYGEIVGDDPETVDVNETCDMQLSGDGKTLKIFANFSDEFPPDSGDLGFGVRFEVRNGIRVPGSGGTIYSVGSGGGNQIQHQKFGMDTSYLDVTFF